MPFGSGKVDSPSGRHDTFGAHLRRISRRGGHSIPPAACVSRRASAARADRCGDEQCARPGGKRSARWLGWMSEVLGGRAFHR
jgi:hypothetical protein